MAKSKSISYQDAGVSIDEADRAVASIKRLARSTFTPGVLTDIGSFGACFALPKMRRPVLISSVDGVGTKLKVAFLAGKHDTVGEDLVNHCVNDIAVQGALPLYFLDYFSTGKLDARVAAAVVSGMARACRSNQCALIGGETAEMPGLYQAGEYDLAGAIVGIAERDKLITGHRVAAGDIILGLPSTGLHTNGYSLARKLIFETAGLKPDSYVEDFGATVAEELLKVHRSYLKPIRALHAARLLRAAAHITGGGLTENTPRVLPKGLAVRIDVTSWRVPPVFEFLRRIGSIPVDDWRRTFNLGVGMLLIVAAKDAPQAEVTLRKLRERPFVIGEVVTQRRGKDRVTYD
ncbi:phosphoribosylformylglycinamidine cyclo-ligase [Nevskia soli]|jgi:phosphoribosylformylglycinamidine cyclo-ligase|uniref:phosphoribosylformylglycinamidine cyclo-ligase n=1 Tax=Nevskia soli TaxID=418856 RepID=UPI0015D8132A|nr:phosphoribosylformylglycinamidine cyclo-ligase [Nevskia soli]